MMRDDQLEYFAAKTKIGAQLIAERAKLIDATYTKQVHRLAHQKTDEAMRQFILERMNPNYIAWRVQHIFDLLEIGRVADAHSVLDQLRTDLQFIDNQLRLPIFNEAKKMSDRRKAGGRARGSKQTQAAEMAWKPYTNLYERLRDQGVPYLKARRSVVAKMATDEFRLPATDEFPTGKTIAKWLPENGQKSAKLSATKGA